jgi:hypothetical protein
MLDSPRSVTIQQKELLSVVTREERVRVVGPSSDEQMTATLVGLGRVVCRRRLTLGLELAQVARAVGVNRTYYSDIEQGQRNISLIELQGLAYALSMNCSDLMHQAELAGQVLAMEPSAQAGA